MHALTAVGVSTEYVCALTWSDVATTSSKPLVRMLPHNRLPCTVAECHKACRMHALTAVGVSTEYVCALSLSDVTRTHTEPRFCLTTVYRVQ